MYCIYCSAQNRRACATVEIEYNKEMTWLNQVNRAAARLVDISTINNHQSPNVPQWAKSMHQLSQPFLPTDISNSNKLASLEAALVQNFEILTVLD